jgi:hypothetical protein
MRVGCLLLLLLSFFACQTQQQETRVERMAKSICGCSSELLHLNKLAAGTTDDIDFEGIQTAFEKTKSCIANQRMKPEDISTVRKTLEIQCPELAAEKNLLDELLGN